MFDLTNIFDLISDPLSRRRLEKDLDQEVKERVLGDEAKPIKQAVVLEVMSPSSEQSDNPKGSNEQYFSIKARIENLHECLPDPVEFIKQKRTNGEINKLIDMSRVIYSLNPVNSPNNNQTTPIPKIGDVVELIEVSKNVYRFNNKISTIQELVGFTKNTDPNESGSRATIDPNSTTDLYNNGSEYVAGNNPILEKFEKDLEAAITKLGLPFKVTDRSRSVDDQIQRILNKYNNNGPQEVEATYGSRGKKMVKAIQEGNQAKLRELASGSSGHLGGMAIDIRSWHYTDDQMEIVLSTIRSLGGNPLVENIKGCWEKSGRNVTKTKRIPGAKPGGEGKNTPCYNEHIHVDIPKQQ